MGTQKERKLKKYNKTTETKEQTENFPQYLNIWNCDIDEELTKPKAKRFTGAANQQKRSTKILYRTQIIDTENNNDAQINTTKARKRRITKSIQQNKS